MAKRKICAYCNERMKPGTAHFSTGVRGVKDIRRARAAKAEELQRLKNPLDIRQQVYGPFEVIKAGPLKNHRWGWDFCVHVRKIVEGKSK